MTPSWSRVSWYFVSRAADLDPRRKLKLVMRIPCDTPHASASMIHSASQKDPSDALHVMTRAETTLHDGATPVTPISLLAIAETQLATVVPWLSDPLPGAPPVPSPVKSSPGSWFRSGCAGSMPPSRI